jgi:hypothetical protein
MRAAIHAVFLLTLLLGSLADPARAALVSERSPVRMGLWWDPQHGGSGFELFRGSDEVAAIWYTYGEDGRPTWYSAIARFDADGRWNAPLMQHRWRNGAHAGATQVGEIAFEKRHFEAIGLRWKIGTREGVQELVPFPVSGIVPEIDHSGAWFDPQRSGFGLSLTEQGEWLGGALYFYDAAGQPSWVVGNNGGQGTRLALQMQTGRCPGCAANDTRVLDSATLELQLTSETRLRATYRSSGDQATWALDGELEQVSAPASRRPADRQLAAFGDTPGLRRYMEEALLSFAITPLYPVVDFSPAPAPESFSSTNLQEAGVDEADRLKTDGRYVYAVANRPHVDEPVTVRIAEVGDNGAQLAVQGAVTLRSAANGLPYVGLYLTPSTLAAIASSQPSGSQGANLWWSTDAWQLGKTVVALFDRGVPRQPALRTSIEFDAHLIASRRVGDQLYLVLRNVPYLPELERGYNADAARTERNRAVILATPTEQMLPRVRYDGGAWQPLLRPEQVHLPVYAGRPPSPELVTIVALDLAAPERVQALAVAGRVDAVYATADALYVANSRSGTLFGPPIASPAFFQVTDVHKVALGAAGPTFVGTGSVEGYLDRDIDRAPFRFSEHAGKLRLVTVADGQWGPLGRNRLTVLEPSSLSPGLLRTLSYLPSRERPAPLGKPDEQLYGTRFFGDTLYAVTFLRVDPLYVVDLADPASPRIAGQVELPGLSEYLHPVGEDLLFGIGYDAVQTAGSTWAWFQGLQFTLFDVSDPAHPRVIEQRTLGKRPSSSAAIQDHHALSVLRTGSGTRFMLPVRVHEPDGSEGPAPDPNLYYPWSWSGLQLLEVSSSDPATARLQSRTMLITHRRAPGGATLYEDDTLYNARSIQFPRGTVYVEHGRFWLAGAEGSFISGPQ